MWEKREERGTKREGLQGHEMRTKGKRKTEKDDGLWKEPIERVRESEGGKGSKKQMR